MDDYVINNGDLFGRLQKHKNIYSLAVDGLEYREDVNGYSRTINDSSKWFGRVRLCYIISESAINTGKETKVSQKS